jgi:thioredoxin 1
MGEVTHLTDADYQSFTGKDGVVLVDFWAPWCGPCKRIGPIIEELAGEMGEVAFGKLNTDENQETAVANGIMSIPTLYVFKDGKKVDQVVGAVPKDALVATLSKYQ